MWPHQKREALTHGGSPGNGTTAALLSREPLATEGEATPGPDDQNPYRAAERQREQAAQMPTAGEDPFVFDDVGAALPTLESPGSHSEEPVGLRPLFERR